MASNSSTSKSLVLPTIYREDFPDKFDEFKSITEYYIQVRVESLDGRPKLTDYWTILDLITGLPYFVDRDNDLILRLFDKRIQAILGELKIADTLPERVLFMRLSELIKSSPQEKRLKERDIDLVDLPWGFVPVSKASKGFRGVKLDDSDVKASMSRGSIGLLFTALLQAGFTKDQKLGYYYPLLSAISGHSPNGWNKAVAKNLPTLMGRGEDISMNDIDHVSAFLTDTLRTIEEIKSQLPKNRRRKK